MNRRGLIIENDPVAPAGILAEWLDERGLPYELMEAWREPGSGRLTGARIDPADYSWIAGLGAEASARSPKPEWIPAQIELLRRAIDKDVPVLGLCFGGQALSLALGGEVETASRPEIGWLEIESSQQDFPTGPWVQYHNEVMLPPPEATVLARSPVGVAAFAYGPHLGIQFHPEAGPESIETWLSRDPRAKLEYKVDPEQIAAEGRRHAPAAAVAARRLFDRWLAGDLSGTHDRRRD